VALDAVPDLVNSPEAWRALQLAGQVLTAQAPHGICTLDPESVCCAIFFNKIIFLRDLAYRGCYNNDDDGFEKSTAKGWNYHQGPVSQSGKNL
jgi:glycogen debranching enzyme